MSSLILDSLSTSRCLQRCRQGADRLKELTDNLSTDLDISNKAKRKWASAKVMLKKSQVDRYKAKLESAIRLLTLSHQIYTRWVTFSRIMWLVLTRIGDSKYWFCSIFRESPSVRVKLVPEGYLKGLYLASPTVPDLKPYASFFFRVRHNIREATIVTCCCDTFDILGMTTLFSSLPDCYSYLYATLRLT